jgi:hypothetical protein
MKKLLLIIGIWAVLISMPAITAFQISEKPTSIPQTKTTFLTTPDEEYDGTFVGGLGHLWKEGEEWQYEVYSYIAGVYKENTYKILYGNIYNLDEEQIGTILMIKFKFFLIGRITDMEEHKAPIVGFIIDYDEDNFIGRIMSLFGPAPHMWGIYTPN